MRSSLAYASLLTLLVSISQADQTRPRLIVLTDISSLDPNLREPDDGQSIIRLMLYANDFDIEGIIASSNMGHGQVVRPELIRQVIDAYAKVHPNLLKHDPRYPSPQSLLDCVKSGQPIADRHLPVTDSIGDDKDTSASNHIISVIDRDDPRPVWITIWGGSADLAQALHKVRKTRSFSDLAKFTSKIKIHFIGHQDSTGKWIEENFPSLWIIRRHNGIRGIYRGGDTSLVSREWVEEHIRQNHGPLGALYPNYNGGDIFSGAKKSPVRGIKEGDTPSFLYLMNNGLNSPDNPTWGGWGGRMKQLDRPNLFTCDVDDLPATKSDWDPRMSSVYRWREDFQNDFAARLDWCVKDFKDANHTPGLSATRDSLSLKSGQRHTLRSLPAADPDKHTLKYEWFLYTDAGTHRGEIQILKNEHDTIEFLAPRVESPQTLHFICRITDTSAPPLTTYDRAVITIHP